VSVRPKSLSALSSKVPVEVRRAFSVVETFLRDVRGAGGAATADDITQTLAAAAAAAGGDPTSLPGQPENLTALGAFNQILLSVDAPPSSWGVVYTEFLRNTVDDYDTATVIGRTGGVSYPDSPPDARLSVDYYYWARFVNALGTGPLNDLDGTLARTADEPGYVLDNLVADKWQATTAYVVDNVVTPTIVDGKALKCTVAGTSGSTEPTWPTVIGNTVVDGGVTWELVATDVTLEKIFKIALVDGNWVAAIKEALIQKLTSENFAAKTIVADSLATAYLQSAVAIIGWALRSSDGLVDIDMTSKTADFEDTFGNRTHIGPGVVKCYRTGVAAPIFEFDGTNAVIRDSDGTVLLQSGGNIDLSRVSGAGDLAALDSLAYSALTGTKPPSDADKTSDNSQSPSWLTSSPVWSGNPITSANQGTFISSLVATWAWIQNAVVNNFVAANANIGTGVVHNLNIESEAYLNGKQLSAAASGSFSTTGGYIDVTHNLGRYAIANAWGGEAYGTTRISLHTTTSFRVTFTPTPGDPTPPSQTIRYAYI